MNATAGSVVSMSDIRACAKACGSHWFEPGAMRFFDSVSLVRANADGRGGAFFVTTEKRSERPASRVGEALLELQHRYGRQFQG